MLLKYLAYEQLKLLEPENLRTRILHRGLKHLPDLVRAKARHTFFDPLNRQPQLPQQQNMGQLIDLIHTVHPVLVVVSISRLK
ncbi:hypothetical protein D3C74_388250 [compost metagenome]